MNYTQKFGQFVQKRRRELGMTQKELSIKISYTNKENIRFISQLELGNIGNITLSTVERLLKALHSKMKFNALSDSKKVKNRILVQTELFD